MSSSGAFTLSFIMMGGRTSKDGLVVSVLLSGTSIVLIFCGDRMPVLSGALI